jgi:hypothetical protein
MKVRQRGQFPGRKFQERLHPFVDVGPLWCGRRFLPSEQLGDVGFRHLGGHGQIPLLSPYFFEPVADEDRKVHSDTRRVRVTKLVNQMRDTTIIAYLDLTSEVNTPILVKQIPDIPGSLQTI